MALSYDTCGDCAYCKMDTWNGRSFSCDYDGRAITRDNYTRICNHFRKPAFLDKNTQYSYQEFYKKTGWPVPYK